MQLNDILEEKDINKISQKTNISKKNLEMLIDEDFTGLIKAKALGFISILERDYQVDLNTLREKALVYYEKHRNDEELIVFTVPVSEENIEETRGSSKWVWLIVFGLLAYASWYLISKYDEKIFSTFIPFAQDKEKAINKKGLRE